MRKTSSLTWARPWTRTGGRATEKRPASGKPGRVGLKAAKRIVNRPWKKQAPVPSGRCIVQAKGFTIVQIDTVSRFSAEPDSTYNNPLNRATSLSSLTLYSDGGSSGDTGPLLAADPSASGLAGEGVGGFEPYLITAVVPQKRVQEAVTLLKQHGGEV